MRRFGFYMAYLLSLHVMALLIFFIFRLVLFNSIDYEFQESMRDNFPLQSIAFIRGVWFDNVIACYILLLPLVTLWIAAMCNYASKWLFKMTTIYLGIFYSLSFVIAAANIPYFCYFFKNINSSIYNWFGYGATTAGMVFGESTYYIPIVLGVGASGFFWWLLHHVSHLFYHIIKNTEEKRSLKNAITIFITGSACIGLCLFGIRGRAGYNPIKVSQAYFCEDPFLNQLGVNPVFNLMTSTLDDRRKENRYLHLMPEQAAIKKVQQLLGRPGIADISPIARIVKQEEAPTHKNVVLIFMESMSAQLMQSFGQKKQLTPFLDSLFHQSCSFSHCFSAGIHTNHGMYATLYSFPAIMKRNAMKGSVVPAYSGLPTVLKENGYRNLFFMTHESQYDNMNAFFRTNGFDEIYAQENYPTDKVVNSFGVQDDFLYQYALPVLNKKAQSGQPFFTVLLSISNHPPYIIPPYFHPRSNKPEEQIVEYADWSIAQFMKEAQKQPWFENTIFVLLGDHGKMVGNPDCEMPQSYNHIPLIFYGKGIKPEIKDYFCGQVDVAPLLLDLLKISYVQNNFGVNVLKEPRPCMFFTADNLIGARDSSYFYIYSPEEETEYRYKFTENGLQVSNDNEQLHLLKEYCFSMLQSAEFLVKEHLTIDNPEK